MYFFVVAVPGFLGIYKKNLSKHNIKKLFFPHVCIGRLGSSASLLIERFPWNTSIIPSQRLTFFVIINNSKQRKYIKDCLATIAWLLLTPVSSAKKINNKVKKGFVYKCTLTPWGCGTYFSQKQ